MTSPKRVGAGFLPLAAVIGMSLLVTSCEDRPITGPSPGPAEPVVPRPAQPASLVIERLSVGMPSGDVRGGASWYRVKFFVRETSGQGAAVIRRIVVTSPDDVDDTGPWCWGDGPIVIAPGGILDMSTPATVDVLLGAYCAPVAVAHSDSFQLSVSITFADATGDERVVEASTTITI